MSIRGSKIWLRREAALCRPWSESLCHGNAVFAYAPTIRWHGLFTPQGIKPLPPEAQQDGGGGAAYGHDEDE